jgi:hypothetical protein
MFGIGICPDCQVEIECTVDDVIVCPACTKELVLDHDSDFNGVRTTYTSTLVLIDASWLASRLQPSQRDILMMTCIPGLPLIASDSSVFSRYRLADNGIINQRGRDVADWLVTYVRKYADVVLPWRRSVEDLTAQLTRCCRHLDRWTAAEWADRLRNDPREVSDPTLCPCGIVWVGLLEQLGSEKTKSIALAALEAK